MVVMKHVKVIIAVAIILQHCHFSWRRLYMEITDSIDLAILLKAESVFCLAVSQCLLHKLAPYPARTYRTSSKSGYILGTGAR